MRREPRGVGAAHGRASGDSPHAVEPSPECSALEVAHRGAQLLYGPYGAV